MTEIEQLQLKCVEQEAMILELAIGVLEDRDRFQELEDEVRELKLQLLQMEYRNRELAMALYSGI